MKIDSSACIPRDHHGHPTGHTEQSFTTGGPAKLAELAKQLAAAERKYSEFLSHELFILQEFCDLVEAADAACKRFLRAEAEHAQTKAILDQRLRDFGEKFGTLSDSSGTSERVKDIAISERSLALIDSELVAVKKARDEAWEAVQIFAAKNRIDARFMPTASDE